MAEWRAKTPRMPRHAFECMVALACLSLAAPVEADERILSYDTSITVNADSTLDVRETIRVRAEGVQIRRGIYREFLANAPEESGGSRAPSEYRFDSVTRNGVPEFFRSQQSGTGLRLYIGSPNETIPPGEHTYQLAYRATNPAGAKAGHDELYWNVTGSYWEFPIDSATATIILPAGIPRDLVRLQAFTGTSGARGAAYRSDIVNGHPTFSTTEPLQRLEGFTVAVEWPKGFVRPGTLPLSVELPHERTAAPASASRYRLPNAWWPFIVAVAGLAALARYSIVLRRRALTEHPDDPSASEYEPLPGKSPACLRQFLKGAYDLRSFAADLISLSVKNYVIVEEGAFTRNTEATGPPLSVAETALLNALFEPDDRVELGEKGAGRIGWALDVHRRLVTLQPHYHSLGFDSGLSRQMLFGGMAVIVAVLIVSAWNSLGPLWYVSHPLGWLTVAVVFFGLKAVRKRAEFLDDLPAATSAAIARMQTYRSLLASAPSGLVERLGSGRKDRFFADAVALDVEEQHAGRIAEIAGTPPSEDAAWPSGWSSRKLWTMPQLANLLARLEEAEDLPFERSLKDQRQRGYSWQVRQPNPEGLVGSDWKPARERRDRSGSFWSSGGRSKGLSGGGRPSSSSSRGGSRSSGGGGGSRGGGGW